jgi:hypothetical protein
MSRYALHRRPTWRPGKYQTQKGIWNGLGQDLSQEDVLCVWGAKTLNTHLKCMKKDVKRKRVHALSRVAYMI